MRKTPKENRESDVGQLAGMNTRQLLELHRKLFGDAPVAANPGHLLQKIAWHVQAAREGGLPDSARQYALRAYDRRGIIGVFEFSSDSFPTSSCSSLAVTRSARSAWTAPAKAPRAGKSRGWSSVQERRRSSWWRRDSGRARWGALKNCWRRWTSLANRASSHTRTGPA